MAQAPTYAPSQRTKTIYTVAFFIGLILSVLGLLRDAPREWHSYLTSFFFFTSLALGGLFFTALQHVTNSGWSVTIRRFSEAMSAFLPFAAAGAFVLLLGAHQLYIWLDPDTVAGDAILRGKSAYLNFNFLIVRLVVFFAAWLIFRYVIVGNSLAQDKDGSESHTVRNAAWSVGFLLVFALSYSLFSVDTLMSLQPHWYSTMWGVYCFAGLFQSTIAALTIIAAIMVKRGTVRGFVTEDHLHDLGKYLKGFTVFMAYIGFSQFLLIWYANLPEETIFYLARSTGGWMAVTFSLFFFKFVVPFLLLLPRAAKRSPNHLIFVSCLLLFMQYIDIHWMVYPNYDSTAYHLSWQELGPFIMLGGLFLYSVTNFLSTNPLIPMRDPRLEEAVHHHVTY
jgi:hypothetical protein